MIVLVRVDSRLVHGQVVEAWLPHVNVTRIVVADDEAAASPLIRAAMGLAVSASFQVQILPLMQVDWASLSADSVRTLVLLRDVQAVTTARERGLILTRLNLGNVHFAPGRKPISPSVFLSLPELEQLRILTEAGVEVEARAVPSERAVGLAEMTERFGKGA